MSCKNVCRLCKRLVISQAVTYDSGVLTVNLPDGSYADGEKYCVVIAQTIPATAIIGAPVVFTIGAGTATFPIVNRCCAQVTAACFLTTAGFTGTVHTA